MPDLAIEYLIRCQEHNYKLLIGSGLGWYWVGTG